MTCFIGMLEQMKIFGVDPTAYAAAVEYNVTHLRPQNNIAGLAFANSLTLTTGYIVLIVLVLVLIVFLIIVMLCVGEGYMSVIGGVILVIVAIALIAIYYMIAIVFASGGYIESLPVFQDTLSDTVLYTFNSVFRDTLYIALCK